jgi:gamma-glutamylcyclotransferase (GGCT)/AIG2-like uncharacterized protein YtfP
MNGLQNLPFFVYGTLLSGYGNYKRILENRTQNEIKAKAYGLKMVSLGAFPMAVATGDTKDEIHGELMYLRPKNFLEISKKLDDLEGYPRFYDRAVINAVPHIVGNEGRGMVEAYIYVSPLNFAAEYLEKHPVVVNGNWREHGNG